MSNYNGKWISLKHIIVQDLVYHFVHRCKHKRFILIFLYFFHCNMMYNIYLNYYKLDKFDHIIRKIMPPQSNHRSMNIIADLFRNRYLNIYFMMHCSWYTPIVSNHSRLSSYNHIYCHSEYKFMHLICCWIIHHKYKSLTHIWSCLDMTNNLILRVHHKSSKCHGK